MVESLFLSIAMGKERSGVPTGCHVSVRTRTGCFLPSVRTDGRTRAATRRSRQIARAGGDERWDDDEAGTARESPAGTRLFTARTSSSSEPLAETVQSIQSSTSAVLYSQSAKWSTKKVWFRQKEQERTDLEHWIYSSKFKALRMHPKSQQEVWLS